MALRRKPRRVVPKLAVLFATMALCVGAGELLVRVLFADDILLFPRFHTAAHYGDFEIRRLRSNERFYHTSRDGTWAFATNGQGFRDTDEYTYDKSEKLLRVISLGDSHTQGFEVRQSATYSEVMERALVRSGRVSQVMNTGISGFSTAEALVFLENEGIRYSPDVVVLGLFANDFEDNVKAGLFALEDGKLETKKRSHIPGVRILDGIHRVPGLPWLSQNSYLYSLAFNTAWEYAKDLLLEKREAELATEYAIADGALDDHTQRLLVSLLQRMRHVCRENGALFVILDIPQLSADGFSSSIPESLEVEITALPDAFVSSEAVLSRYRGILDTHVPGGQRHINEFTHAMLGLAAADIIRELVP